MNTNTLTRETSSRGVKMPESLSFAEIIVAYLVYKDPGVLQRDLLPYESRGGEGGKYNDFIEEHDIKANLAIPLTSNLTLVNMIKRIREAGLMKPDGSYHPTGKCKEFFKKIGTDPAGWPVDVPYKGKKILWDDVIWEPINPKEIRIPKEDNES